jgi:hypothetical protein
MRKALAIVCLIVPTSAFARGSGGWGWIIISAPFVVLVFTILGGFAEAKVRRRSKDESGAFIIFVVSVFIGVLLAVFLSGFIAELVGVSREGGAWALLLIEFVCFIPYALWKDRREKFELTSDREPK